MLSWHKHTHRYHLEELDMEYHDTLWRSSLNVSLGLFGMCRPSGTIGAVIRGLSCLYLRDIVASVVWSLCPHLCPCHVPVCVPAMSLPCPCHVPDCIHVEPFRVPSLVLTVGTGPHV